MNTATDRRPSSSAAPHLPGEEGIWVFIFGDMVVFGVFFGTIAVARAHDRATFATSQAMLHPALGLVNTLLLLTASLLVVLGMRALRAGVRSGRWLFLGALACAAGFAAVKVTEYLLVLGDGARPSTSDFFMYYFIFTGIHLTHLVIGSIVLVFLARRTAKGKPNKRRIRAAECGACYWHMVDVLWLVLYPMLYLVR